MIIMPLLIESVTAQITDQNPPSAETDKLEGCEKKLSESVKIGNQLLDELTACEDLATARLLELKRLKS